MEKFILSFFICCVAGTSQAQDINVIIQQVKQKLALVNDYEATGLMKTNVTFLKVPIANVKVFYKKPDKLRIKSQKGVSFIPKGAVSINMSSVLNNGNYTVIDAGTATIGNTTVRIAKLLPADDNADIVLSTIYIDPVSALVRRAKTTTKENGTYELEMTYGKYGKYGLPDKIVFAFNSKDYKLPKAVTFDFDDGSKPARPADKNANKKGRAEISLTNYIINKGVAESNFK